MNHSHEDTPDDLSQWLDTVGREVPDGNSGTMSFDDDPAYADVRRMYGAAAPGQNGQDEDRATELANAEELFRIHGDNFRWDADRGLFIRWDARRFVPDVEGHVTRAAMAVAKSTSERLADVVDDKTRQRFQGRAESAAGIHGVLTLFKAFPGITVTAERLDADPMLLNCPNGTVNLRNGQLQPHRREDLITMMVETKYDPNAISPLWSSFVDRAMGGNPALVDYLQRLAGRALTGNASDHTLPIPYGPGGNGKSVFFDTLVSLCGSYAGIAPDSLLMAGRTEHPTEIADLRGKRLVVSSETEAGGHLNINRVKQLTGNLIMKGRYMRQDYFEFKRTHTLVLITNNRPRLSEDSEAVWRRLRIIPFTVVIPPHERDPQLMEKLAEEYEGILAWAVRGCLNWQHNPIQPPAEVMVATDEYRQDSDDLAEFIVERCIVGGEDDTFRVSRSDLHTAYLAWCKSHGERQPLPRPVFYDAIRRREGIDDSEWKASGNKVRGFKGIALTSSTEGGGSWNS